MRSYRTHTVNEQQTIRHAGIQQVSLKTLEKVSFFKRTENLFIYKKSERLMAAAFAVSDSVVSDTLREQIRGESLKLFSGVRDAVAARGAISVADGGRLSLFALSLAALLEVACRLGEVSEGNYGLLRGELAKPGESLNQVQDCGENLLDRRILEDGLATEKQRPAARLASLSRRRAADMKLGFEVPVAAGQAASTPRADFPTTGGVSDAAPAGEPNSIKDREEIVLNIVRKIGRVSIKDVLSEMPLVGEKTLQRTISGLVLKGSLKKFGDRRWSRYEASGFAVSVP